MSSSALTCIVVNYLCAEATVAAVASVLGDSPETEMLVVDNSVSADERALLGRLLPPSTHLMVAGSNLGFGRACQWAFEQANSDFVLLMNPDTVALPGSICKLLDVLRSQPQLGAVSPLQFWDSECRWMLPPAWLPTGTGNWTLAQAARSARDAHRLSMAYRRVACLAWSASCGFVPQRALSGGAMMVRRSAAISIGRLFDPSFFMYYEDSDLCLRLKRAGWGLALAPHAHVRHEWTHSARKVEMLEAGKQRYFERNFNNRGQWQQRLNRCLSLPAVSNPLRASLLPVATDHIEVPSAWQSGWLLELSPSDLMIPSIGCRGSGSRANLPVALLPRLGLGPTYFRLGPIHANGEALPAYVMNGPEADTSGCATGV